MRLDQGYKVKCLGRQSRQQTWEKQAGCNDNQHHCSALKTGLQGSCPMFTKSQLMVTRMQCRTGTIGTFNYSENLELYVFLCEITLFLNISANVAC